MYNANIDKEDDVKSVVVDHLFCTYGDTFSLSLSVSVPNQWVFIPDFIDNPLQEFIPYLDVLRTSLNNNDLANV